MLNNLFSKIAPCLKYVDTYGGAGEDRDDDGAHAHCITTNTHREYLIITVYQPQLRLDEGNLILNFAHIAFIVCLANNMTGIFLTYIYISLESRIVTWVTNSL
jgi:hypothetical protein